MPDLVGPRSMRCSSNSRGFRCASFPELEPVVVASVSNLSLTDLLLRLGVSVGSLGVSVGSCRRLGARLRPPSGLSAARLSAAGLLGRARLPVDLSCRLDPLLALGLLALTRLGFSLFDRAVLDFLGLALMGQTGDGELLVFLAALDPALFEGLLSG